MPKGAILAIGCLFATAAIGYGLAVGETAQQVAVNITFTCPPNLEQGPLTVGVAPWIRTASPGDTVRWNLSPNTGTMILRSDSWPLPSPLSGDPDITAQIPDNAASGLYNYEIELQCQGQRVIIDPGMRIGRDAEPTAGAAASAAAAGSR